MEIYIDKEDPYLGIKKRLSIIIIILIICSSFVFGLVKIQEVLADNHNSEEYFSELVSIEGNSLLSVSSPVDPVRTKKVKVVITAYSSTCWQTDDTPFTTASGETVRDGIIANNMLPFGTEVMIPELYGDKVFIVEDRMNARKGYYHVDIWFSEYEQAKEFGAKTTYIEILES
jgi:3D (Asp-Asp-Asp) domain-containing protein